MKPRYPLTRRAAEADPSPPLLSVASFCQTALGRAVLHLDCLCHHPAAARFHFMGLTRNLREGAKAAKQSVMKSLKKPF